MHILFKVHSHVASRPFPSRCSGGSGTTSCLGLHEVVGKNPVVHSRSETCNDKMDWRVTCLVGLLSVSNMISVLFPLIAMELSRASMKR